MRQVCEDHPAKHAEPWRSEIQKRTEHPKQPDKLIYSRVTLCYSSTKSSASWQHFIWNSWHGKTRGKKVCWPVLKIRDWSLAKHAVTHTILSELQKISVFFAPVFRQLGPIYKIHFSLQVIYHVFIFCNKAQWALEDVRATGLPISLVKESS